MGRLEDTIKPRITVKDATALLFKLRAIKSDAEVELQRELCHMHSNALDKIPDIVRVGMTEREIARLARIEVLKAGADHVPYIACRSGAGGYTDIVGAATNRRIVQGDTLIIDVGSMLAGYCCDFNRNWYVGTEVPQELISAHDSLYSAVDAGIQAAQPGRTTADIFHAMASALPGPESSVGRAGHGVGMVLTEWPSILPAKSNRNVTLEDGMVFAFEPSLGFGDNGQFLVHEEMVVIREGRSELLSIRGPRSLPLITKGLHADL